MSLYPEKEVMEFDEKLHVHNSRHLKALNISARINGKPCSRVLVDGGSTLNLIPYKFFKKFDHGKNMMCMEMDPKIF